MSEPVGPEGAPVLKVLILEDNPNDAELMARSLQHEGVALDWHQADTRQEFLKSLDNDYDVILAVYTLPHYDALQALHDMQERGLDIPFIVLTRDLSDEVTASCLKDGASDYLLKDRLTQLPVAVRRALEEKAAKVAREQAEQQLRESEERFRKLAENAQDIVFRYRLRPEPHIEYISPAVTAILGYAPDECYAEPSLLTRIFLPEDQHFFHTRLNDPSPLLQAAPAEMRWVRLDGQVRWIERRMTPLLDAQGNILAVDCIARDITDRKRSEEHSARLAAIVESSRDAIIGKTLDGIVTIWNQGAANIYGYTAAEMLGRSIACLFPSDRQDELVNILNRIRQGERIQLYETYRVHKNGHIIEESVHIDTIKDDQGNVIGAASFARDITEHKRLVEQLEQRAVYDALTGLPNRVLLLDRLQQAILTATRQQSIVALLILDIDHFKEVNHTFGHPAGDGILIQVTERLLGAVGEADTVARLVGDEFAVVTSQVDSGRSAMLVAARLLALFAAGFEVQGVAIHRHASVGVALYPAHGGDATTLMSHAEVAMYQAKQSGQGGSVLYVAERDPNSPSRMSLAAELHQAIADRQFVVYYQPKQELASGRIVSVEALIRWLHPTRGLIPPDQFIPLAEETGMIGEVTAMVLRMAVQQVWEWGEAGLDLAVAVNLSAFDFHDAELPEKIGALLEEWSVRPSHLVVEITESTLLDDPTLARQSLMRLREMGVKIAIDDFGIGYSSLAYLKLLPVDELKVDASFVQNAILSHRDQAIVKSAIELGHGLQMQVVAEGVEDEATRNLLISLSCDVIQGFYLSRPLPPDELERWIKAQRKVYPRTRRTRTV